MSVDLQVIRIRSERQQRAGRVAARLLTDECDVDGRAVRNRLARHAGMLHQGGQLRTRPHEGGHREAERLLEPRLNRLLEAADAPLWRLEQDVAARDDGFNVREAHRAEHRAQRVHLDDAAAHVDGAQERSVPRHGEILPDAVLVHRERHRPIADRDEQLAVGHRQRDRRTPVD
jgi:hypothetical protein